MFYRDLEIGGSYGGSTNSFKPKSMNKRINDMLSSSVEEVRNLGKVLKEEESIKEVLHIAELRELQELHPEIIASGSTALYLHGIRLERFKHLKSDLDIVIPYYIPLSDLKNHKFGPPERRGASNEFDWIYTSNARSVRELNIDVRIDPKEPYEYIEMDEFRFKVALIENIIAAKIRYIQIGWPTAQKHKDDLYEILGKKVIIPEPEPTPSRYRGS